jgi:hypothetical protein
MKTTKHILAAVISASGALGGKPYVETANAKQAYWLNFRNLAAVYEKGLDVLAFLEGISPEGVLEDRIAIARAELTPPMQDGYTAIQWLQRKLICRLCMIVISALGELYHTQNRGEFPPLFRALREVLPEYGNFLNRQTYPAPSGTNWAIFSLGTIDGTPIYTLVQRTFHALENSPSLSEMTRPGYLTWFKQAVATCTPEQVANVEQRMFDMRDVNYNSST